MKNLKLKRAFLVAGGLCAASSGMSSMAWAQDCTTKVGAVLPISVDWGRPIGEVAKFAVEIFNEAGGVKGCKVDMILRDSQVDPKVGVDAAKALVDLDKVPLLLAAVSSGVSMPILTSVAVPSNVMQMSCCSASTAFTDLAKEGKTKGLFYRTYATARVQSAVGAMLIKDKAYKKMAIVYKNDDWGQDLSKRLKADLEKIGVEVTSSVAINDAQPSYKAEVTEALKGSPEAIYMAIYPAEGTTIAREWLSLGGTQNMVMANALKSDEFRDGVGLKYLGNAIGHDAAAPRTDSAKAFVDMYKAKFDKEPNGPGLPNMFDAVMVSLLAMNAAPEGAGGDVIAAHIAKVTDPNGTPVSSDVAGLKKAIEILNSGKTVSYHGGTGAVQFDANGNVSAPAVSWFFDATGVKEDKYITLQEVDGFIATLSQ